MLFNSLSFLIFLAIIFTIYYITPQKFRWVILLISSFYFYMCWKVESVLILLFYIIINYIVAIEIDKTKNKENQSKNKVYISISVISSIGMLLFFKYFNFFNSTLRELFKHFNLFYGIKNINIIAPLGISFYTFKTLSYVIDVYRGIQKPEKNIAYFALYVSFFPQILAGPIDRASNLLPQLHEKHSFDYDLVVEGFRRILWGAFKKIVIADRLALVVNQVYNHSHTYSGLPLIIATYSYALQLYCDFSGYSDMAIGTARIFGIKSIENFNHPYVSQTISEFWRRWHMSLSNWFNDYVYMPIVFSKKELGKLAVVIAAIVTFSLSGLWHGAAWTYVIWGTMHGIGVSFDALTKKQHKKLKKKFNKYIFKYISIFLTFNFVCFSFIFFRANSISDALYIVRNLFNFGNKSSIAIFNSNLMKSGFTQIDLINAIISIIILQIVELIERKEKSIDILKGKPLILRWTSYYALILWIIFFGVFGAREFIYFQF